MKTKASETLKEDDQSIRMIAMNDNGIFLLWKKSGYNYCNVPTNLHQLMSEREDTPCKVFLGTKDRYYVSFADGSAQFVCSQSLVDALKRKPVRTVKLLAFRPDDFNASFVLFEDGSYEYWGMPSQFKSFPQSAFRRLHHLTLGEGNCYFASFTDWSSRWCLGGTVKNDVVPTLKSADRALLWLNGSSNEYILWHK